MKRLAILGLALLLTPNIASKKPKIYATFPPSCKPKARLVQMECIGTGEFTWRCTGGYVEIKAFCIQYVQEEGKPFGGE